jgi:hypothetical protein
MKIRIICLATVSLAFSTTIAAEDWSFGIGTRLTYRAFTGDGGFHTKSHGPVEFNASMKPNEVQEITESAFGFDGFARKGDWKITYQVTHLELQDDISVERDEDIGDFDLSFTTESVEVLVNYAFSNFDKSTWGVIGGVRYISQEYADEVFVNGMQIFDDSAKEDWTDAVIGLSYDYAYSPTTTWTSEVDVSFGGSEGSYRLISGVNWYFSEHWLLRSFLDLRKVEFRQGDPGDSDFFMYDADEIKFGLNLLYLF